MKLGHFLNSRGIFFSNEFNQEGVFLPMSQYTRFGKSQAALSRLNLILFFLLSARRRLRGHPYKALQGGSQRPRRGSAFSVRVVKYWNKLPAAVVTEKVGEG